MLIMSETIYRVPPEQQKLFFNEGLHRSMIWVLDKYIRTIRDIPLGDGKFMAPVFENIDLGPRQTSFAALTSATAPRRSTPPASIDVRAKLEPKRPGCSASWATSSTMSASLAAAKTARRAEAARCRPLLGAADPFSAKRRRPC